MPQPIRFRVGQLDGEAGQLWTQARSAEHREPEAAIENYRRFLVANPPEPFLSNARLALARLLGETGENEAALEVLNQLRETVERTEAGLPVAVLAEFQRVLLLAAEVPENQAQLRAAADRLGAAIVERPSLIASRLFEGAAELLEDLDPESAETVRLWQAVWARDEATRDFHARVAPRLRESIGIPYTRVTSDEDGRWEYPVVPAEFDRIQIGVHHPDYASHARWDGGRLPRS